MKKILITGALALVMILIQGCGGFSMEEYLPDKKVEYEKTTEVGNDLEIPPDLTNVKAGSELYVPGVSGSGSATYSEFLGEKQIASQGRALSVNVMPKPESVTLKREGDERWLVVQGSPQMVWPNVVNFWRENGILLIEQDPTVGVMKTGWLENRADIGEDFITGVLKKYVGGLYSTSTRDQYRIRLEEGLEAGTTEVYLTHFGMQEVGQGNAGGNDPDTFIWAPRDRDITLEAEMLRRLMVFLGVEDQRAETLVAQKGQKRTQRSEMVVSTRETKLIVDESFAKTWRLTGLALDRVGFAVEDRDRSAGIYYVRYNDPMADVETDEGWLSKLKFWGDSKVEEDMRFQIAVEQVGERSEVIVKDPAGNKLVTETAGRILTLVHEQIR
jgi:outer membrane protein assembly factor BamC